MKSVTVIVLETVEETRQRFLDQHQGLQRTRSSQASNGSPARPPPTWSSTPNVIMFSRQD